MSNEKIRGGGKQEQVKIKIQMNRDLSNRLVWMIVIQISQQRIKTKKERKGREGAAVSCREALSIYLEPITRMTKKEKKDTHTKMEITRKIDNW